MGRKANVIQLTGDIKNQESAETIIVFPGGSISVCRTTDNEYWAHIDVNHGQVIEDTIRASKSGEIVSSRLDYTNPPSDIRKMDTDKLNHIAVLIKTKDK